MKEECHAQSPNKNAPYDRIEKQDLERETAYTQNSQGISLSGLPPLRQRTFSSMGINQARKIGYLLRSPSLRPQKCEQSPPPMKLPSPMQRVLQTTAIDELSLSAQHLPPHPHSAPEEIHFSEPQEELNRDMCQEEVIFFEADSQVEDDDSPFGSFCLDPEQEELMGAFHFTGSNSPVSSALSPNSILGFLARSSLEHSNEVVSMEGF